MRFSKVHAAQAYESRVSVIDVETDLSRGLHSFTIVGLPDKNIAEARDRISSAIKNSGFESPKTKNNKITISLAPSSIKKGGNSFDLAMAMGYLLAAEDISFVPEGKIFIGELSLDGKVRPVNGTLSMVRAAKEKGYREVYVSPHNCEEALQVSHMRIFSVDTLRELADHVQGISPLQSQLRSTPLNHPTTSHIHDFSLIQGQEKAKRCLLIAAVGKHHCLIEGLPGTGKTLLAKSFPSILPELSEKDALEINTFYSQFHLPRKSFTHPPFRSPHHTSSYASILGSGNKNFPGEIALAHKGVIFFDEFPEFDRRVIEGLREPLENRFVSVARANGAIEYKADCIFIAATNPCPCGYFKSSIKKCTCPPARIHSYRAKISGPIHDRIDLKVTTSSAYIYTKSIQEDSESLKQKVTQARIFSEEIRNTSVEERILPATQRILTHAVSKRGLSYRALEKIKRVAASIANLDQEIVIREQYLNEALEFH